MRWQKHEAFERVKNLRPSGSGVAERRKQKDKGATLCSEEAQDSFNCQVTETITAPNACESPKNKLRRRSKNNSSY